MSSHLLFMVGTLSLWLSQGNNNCLAFRIVSIVSGRRNKPTCDLHRSVGPFVRYSLTYHTVHAMSGVSLILNLRKMYKRRVREQYPPPSRAVQHRRVASLNKPHYLLTPSNLNNTHIKWIPSLRSSLPPPPPPSPSPSRPPRLPSMPVGATVGEIASSRRWCLTVGRDCSPRLHSDDLLL